MLLIYIYIYRTELIPIEYHRGSSETNDRSKQCTQTAHKGKHRARVRAWMPWRVHINTRPPENSHAHEQAPGRLGHSAAAGLCPR